MKIEPAALCTPSRAAPKAAMRDAESTLDQLISFCGDKIEEAGRALHVRSDGAKPIARNCRSAVLAGEIETALRQLNDLAKNGKDLGRLVSDLLNHFRNLLIFQVSRGDLTMLEVSEAEAAALHEQAEMAYRRRADAHHGGLGRRGDALARCRVEKDSGRSRPAESRSKRAMP